MPFWLVKLSWSPPEKPPLMMTCAPARLVSSGSVTVNPDVIVVAGLPCVYDWGVASILATTGGLFDTSTVAVPTDCKPDAFWTVYRNAAVPLLPVPGVKVKLPSGLTTTVSNGRVVTALTTVSVDGGPIGSKSLASTPWAAPTVSGVLDGVV